MKKMKAKDFANKFGLYLTMDEHGAMDIIAHDELPYKSKKYNQWFSNGEFMPVTSFVRENSMDCMLIVKPNKARTMLTAQEVADLFNIYVAKDTTNGRVWGFTHEPHKSGRVWVCEAKDTSPLYYVNALLDSESVDSDKLYTPSR